jgi:hypothetical protein
LPSLRGLPWRPCLAGGMYSSGAFGMVVRLSTDQQPESASAASGRSSIPAAASVVAVACRMGSSWWMSLASQVSSAATITCSKVVTAWAL